MPVADPGSGRFFIWVVSCILFTSVAVGGSFLITYLILPPKPTHAWLAVAGVTLICLPWVFWVLMCCYRIISRACGFRVAIGSGGDAGNHALDDAFCTTGNAPPNDPSNLESALGTLQGGADDKQARGMGHQNDNGGNEMKTDERGFGASNFGEDISVRSHESELPLKSAMAS